MKKDKYKSCEYCDSIIEESFCEYETHCETCCNNLHDECIRYYKDERKRK